MSNFRAGFRVLVVLAATAGLAASGCRGMSPGGFSGDVDVLLARGRVYAAGLERQPGGAAGDADLVALGYLERARLGLGSPFRLVDFALEDPSLDSIARTRLAYALLAMALDGRTYQVHPDVLEAVRFFGVRPNLRLGAAQLALVERSIEAAPTAGSGERSVRLGYRLAESARVVEGVSHPVIAQVAALVADRRRAREDARNLLRTAASTGSDPLVLLREWRRTLRFATEAPALVPLSPGEELSVARSGPVVARAIEALPLRLASSRADLEAVVDPGAATLLDAEAAIGLVELAAERDYPAQAPVRVAALISRDALVEFPELAPWERQAREDFVDSAWNEERLVAGVARLAALGGDAGAHSRLVVLRAATFMRAWNQEEPWFPGDAAPARKDLVGRFGLAAIEFGDDVPERWRPYYLRDLGRALAELQRVLPTASVRGLTIHIGPLADGRALATHDPRARRLVLPPGTGSGTIAHEIAHDLDWQLARKRYGTRGTYATDVAVRSGRGDRVESSIQGLAAAFRPPGADSLIDRHDSRPAEVFARSTDWFVATSLAREGRTGGYLSSFQDPGLTGYGSTRGPDIGGGAVPALLAILDEIAPVVDSTRQWALATYGPTRTLSPRELSNAILGAGADLPPERRIAAIAAARDRALESVSAPSCRLTSERSIRLLTAAQTALIGESTEAAARGAAMEAIRALSRERLGEPARAATERWLAWRLRGAPEPVDSAVLALAPSFEDLLYRAGQLSREQTDGTGSAFRSPSRARLCGSNPFATQRAFPVARLHGGDGDGTRPALLVPIGG